MRRLPRRAAPVLLLAPLSQAAHAHANLGELPAFWAGALHVFLTPLAIASLLGLAAATAVAAERLQFRTVFAAAAVAALAAAFAPALLVQSAWALLAPAGTLLVGLCAAMGLVPRIPLALVLALLAATTIGLAAMPEPRTVVASLGVGVAVVVALFWLLEGLRRVDARWPVARRVLGAWVAAFALLVGALLYVALFGRPR